MREPDFSWTDQEIDRLEDVRHLVRHSGSAPWLCSPASSKHLPVPPHPYLGGPQLHLCGSVPCWRHLRALPVRRLQQPGPAGQRGAWPAAGVSPAAADAQSGVSRPDDDVCGDASGRGVERDGAVVRGKRSLQAALLPEAVRHARLRLHPGCHQPRPSARHPAPAGRPERPPQEPQNAIARLEPQSAARIASAADLPGDQGGGGELHPVCDARQLQPPLAGDALQHVPVRLALRRPPAGHELLLQPHPAAHPPPAPEGPSRRVATPPQRRRCHPQGQDEDAEDDGGHGAVLRGVLDAVLPAGHLVLVPARHAARHARVRASLPVPVRAPEHLLRPTHLRLLHALLQGRPCRLLPGAEPRQIGPPTGALVRLRPQHHQSELEVNMMSQKVVRKPEPDPLMWFWTGSASRSPEANR